MSIPSTRTEIAVALLSLAENLHFSEEMRREFLWRYDNDPRQAIDRVMDDEEKLKLEENAE